jgi:hypothetical protein
MVPHLLAERDRHPVHGRITFVKPDGTPCTTWSGERANSGAPPVLVAFGDYDTIRLKQFAAEMAGHWWSAGSCSEARRC